MNTVGIDAGEKKCKAAAKDRKGQILSEFFFSNDKDRIDKLTKIALGYGKCEAVIESTANIWIDDRINSIIIMHRKEIIKVICCPI